MKAIRIMTISDNPDEFSTIVGMASDANTYSDGMVTTYPTVDTTVESFNCSKYRD